MQAAREKMNRKGNYVMGNMSSRDAGDANDINNEIETCMPWVQSYWRRYCEALQRQRSEDRQVTEQTPSLGRSTEETTQSTTAQDFVTYFLNSVKRCCCPGETTSEIPSVPNPRVNPSPPIGKQPAHIASPSLPIGSRATRSQRSADSQLATPGAGASSVDRSSSVSQTTERPHFASEEASSDDKQRLRDTIINTENWHAGARKLFDFHQVFIEADAREQVSKQLQTHNDSRRP